MIRLRPTLVTLLVAASAVLAAGFAPSNAQAAVPRLVAMPFDDLRLINGGFDLVVDT